jgi:hypothetical protein
MGKLPCESLGHIHLVPHSADLVLPRQVIPYCSISCSTCVPYCVADTRAAEAGGEERTLAQIGRRWLDLALPVAHRAVDARAISRSR